MTDIKPGAIVHAELASNDIAATRRFLEKVFAWKFKKEEMGPDMEYWTFNPGSGPAGGLMPAMEGRPPSTVNYMLVESVDAAVKKITSNGGTILVPKQEIPKVGWCAIFEIPGGVMAAVFQPKMP